MFEDMLWLFLVVGAAAFVIASVVAPIGLLTWWAGSDAEPYAPQSPAGAVAKRCVIYLGGIDTIDGDKHSERERNFLNALSMRVPEVILIDGVFPYAARGESLLQAPRLFSWLWRALAPAPEAARRPLRAYVINFRNLFQVLVAADRRYGPIYSAALAGVVWRALAAKGVSAGAELVLIGYSGGAQMAVSIAPNLRARGAARIEIVSIGGTIIDAGGLGSVARLDYLTAEGDVLPGLAACTSFDRWPFHEFSAWARAEREGRIARRNLGRMRHLGPNGYLGAATAAGAHLANWAVTLDAVIASISAAPNPGLLASSLADD
ncbi:MAG: hypothetical protein K2P58_13355 [Hyphomonadaceae bacterium]|nr:hypothetical protein [Hyphomonadaceae bacterium]